MRGVYTKQFGETLEETALQALENDCHLVAMSSLAVDHMNLLHALIEELKKHGRADIMVACDGVIHAYDYDYLYENGARAIFGPSTVIPDSAKKMLELFLEEQP